MYFEIRTVLEPLSIVPTIRQIVTDLDNTIPMMNISTQTQLLKQSIVLERIFTSLCGSLAALGVLLSCIGLYGLLSFMVTRRTNEIGIRMALGARPSQVLTLILQQGFALSAVGLVLGIVLALGVTRLMAGLLYGVGTTDIASFTLVPAGLMFTALLASTIPARRAARVDPVAALRME